MEKGIVRTLDEVLEKGRGPDKQPRKRSHRKHLTLGELKHWKETSNPYRTEEKHKRHVEERRLKDKKVAMVEHLEKSNSTPKLTKDEAREWLNLKIRQWTKSGIQSCPKKEGQGPTVDKISNRIWERLVDEWGYNPTILSACRAVNCDQEYVTSIVSSFFDMDGKPFEIKDEHDLVGMEPKQAEQYADTARPYYASLVSLDEAVLEKARTKGAKDKEKRKRKYHPGSIAGYLEENPADRRKRSASRIARASEAKTRKHENAGFEKLWDTEVKKSNSTPNEAVLEKSKGGFRLARGEKGEEEKKSTKKERKAEGRSYHVERLVERTKERNN